VSDRIQQMIREITLLHKQIDSKLEEAKRLINELRSEAKELVKVLLQKYDISETSKIVAEIANAVKIDDVNAWIARDVERCAEGALDVWDETESRKRGEEYMVVCVADSVAYRVAEHYFFNISIDLDFLP
jgi:hypothetical protein